MPRVIIRGAGKFKRILGAREIETEITEGSTVESLISELNKRLGGQLKGLLYNEDGTQRYGVRIFLNGRDLRFLDKQTINLRDGDILLFLPVFAGG